MSAHTANHSGATALVIDWTACDGRGMCMELLPELLEPDLWGYPKARADVSPGALAAVPEQFHGPARQAVSLCPLLALRLESR